MNIESDRKSSNRPELGILEEDDEFEEFPVEGSYILLKTCSSGGSINLFKNGMLLMKKLRIRNNGKMIGI